MDNLNAKIKTRDNGYLDSEAIKFIDNVIKSRLSEKEKVSEVKAILISLQETKKGENP